MIIEYWNKVRSFVKWLIPFFLAIFLLFGCGPAQTQESRADMPVHQEQAGQAETSALALDKDGSYTSKEDVALYIHIYGTLPGNFITKKEAENAGWVSREGNLWDVAPGKSIGEALSVIMKRYCRIRMDGSGLNATSTMKEASGMRSVLFIPTTA